MAAPLLLFVTDLLWWQVDAIQVPTNAYHLLISCIRHLERRIQSYLDHR